MFRTDNGGSRLFGEETTVHRHVSSEKLCDDPSLVAYPRERGHGTRSTFDGRNWNSKGVRNSGRASSSESSTFFCVCAHQRIATSAPKFTSVCMYDCLAALLSRPSKI